jgi:NADPH:quinone reductase-like Zn-dependent oxidoreductase
VNNAAVNTAAVLPRQIRAYAVPGPGEPPRWRTVPCPQPAPGEVLVRVAVAALNPVDVAIAAGRLHDGFRYQYPVTLGRDFAGPVVAVGSAVTRFAVGDEVFGWVPVARPTIHAGAFAEYVAIGEDVAIARRPAGLTRATSAALPLSGAAAHTALDAVRPRPGAVLLVAGATGGVGRHAVALAARAGATVIATGRPDDEPALRALGAAEVVGYEAAEAAVAVTARHPGRIDGLVYLVARPTGFAALAALVRPGGRIATTVHAADPEALAARGITAVNVRAPDDPELVARLGRLTVDGVLFPAIASVLEAPALGDGLARLARERTRGKLIVTIG